MEQLFYRAPGGTGRYTARLAASIADEFSSDEVVPFMAWHTSAAMKSTFKRWRLEEAPLGPAVRLPLPRPALYEAWNTLDFPGPGAVAKNIRNADVIHSPTVAVPPARCPLVVSVHDAGPFLFPSMYTKRGLRWHTKAMGLVAERAELVICASEAAREEIARFSPVPAERLRVVPHGVDAVQATEAETQRALVHYGLAGVPYVLWVGSLEPRKNVTTLVLAFAKLAKARNTAAALVLVGPIGWLHEGIVPSAARAELGERLRVLGEVPESDLRCLYAGASVFAFPSLHEGFGLPVLEAMAQGTPVACSDLPVLREVTAGAAVFVEAQDVDAWAEALSSLAQDSQSDSGAAPELVAAGKKRAAELSWDKAARATHAVYEEALRRRS